MSKLPVRREKRLPRTTDADVRDVAAFHDAPPPTTSASTSGFAFRYSYTEISAIGTGATIKHAETRFDNGKLSAESFEGSFDRDTYDDLLHHANEYLLRQSALMLRSLFWFLPARGERSRSDE